MLDACEGHICTVLPASRRSRRALRGNEPGRPWRSRAAAPRADARARPAQAFIGRSRNKRDRLEAAKELKALVFFSNIVVAALLEDVQARPLRRAPSQLQTGCN